MNGELKPCPFCGSEARFVEVSDTMGSMKLTAWKVQCSKCWCSPYPNNAHGDKHVVARQWNTRAERTCHLSDKHPAHSFDGQARDCLECGYEFDCDCGEDERFYYCPGCGAKVVDGGE